MYVFRVVCVDLLLIRLAVDFEEAPLVQALDDFN